MSEQLDDPWFAPSDDDLVAQLAPPVARSSLFSLVVIIGCALLAACVSATAL